MKPLAVITLVRNESYFLPRWVEYYSRVPNVALFVLDHDSTDGSTDNLPAHAVKVPAPHPESERVLWMLRTVQDFLGVCFREGFKRAIYAEVDEFLVPDLDRWGSLAEFLDAHPTEEFVASQGWHVVYRSGDPPLPETGSMLKGRVWKREPFYDMTLVCSQVPNWKLGRHGLEDRPDGPDAGLRMVHLHYADRILGWKRLMDRRRDKPIAADGHGYQNKVSTRDEFDSHWQMMCGDDRGGPATPIPEKYWSVL